MKKTSKVEILFEEVLIQDNKVTIIPSECPGKGRVSNLVYNDTSTPVCIYENVICPYFKKLYIDGSLRNKTIACTVVTIDKVRET